MVSGFIQADATAVAAARARLDGPAGARRRIGVAWRSTNADYGAEKSLRLEDMLPALRRPDVIWVDLQYGDTAAERAALAGRHGITLWRDPAVDPLADLDAAAAQIAGLDLVITASNTAAHVAGALGVPVWLLLPAPGYGLLWYWLLDRDDSPFYPSARCYRQGRAGDWSGPVAAVAAALDAGPVPGT